MPNVPKLDSGLLLIAAAHMADSNFSHSVILLCEHQDQGSFGLILNRLTQLKVSEILPDSDWDCPVFLGGPVEENSLHFLHCRKDIDIGSKEIIPGVFWGGDFDQLNELLDSGVITPQECRFFVGYSGWGAGQLRDEMLTDSWYTREGTADLVFHDNVSNHWRDTLKTMGSDFRIISNFPDDPRFN